MKLTRNDPLTDAELDRLRAMLPSSGGTIRAPAAPARRTSGAAVAPPSLTSPFPPLIVNDASALDTIPREGIHACPWFAMGEFSPTKPNGDCEEIANLSTAFGRRRRNWIDAHGSVPPAQVVDASCGNKHCIALRHSYLRPRVEQPGKYPKIAKRVHRLKIGQHFDVPGVGTDERSRNRFRSGLYAAARLDKVSVHGQPDGSVRVTKVGEWSSLRA